MNNTLQFKVNAVDLPAIQLYLTKRDQDFTPPLSQKLDINKFAEKIYRFGKVYTAHQNNDIIGLIACYANNFETLQAYITNFSIHPGFFGSGLAKELIDYCIDDLALQGFKTVKLEVQNQNLRAINFYKKIGFNKLREDLKTTSIYMVKKIK